MSRSNSTVSVYSSHVEAESALRELQQPGFDMKKLTIVARDYHTDEKAVGYYNAGDRMTYWGKLGAVHRILGQLLRKQRHGVWCQPQENLWPAFRLLRLASGFDQTKNLRFSW